MNTQYPVKFTSSGKLVKYAKPYKSTITYDIHNYTLDYYNDIPLSEVTQWVDSLSGKYEDAILSVERDYNDYPTCVIGLKVFYTEKELEALEKDYQKKLKQYKEWLVLSKEARNSDEVKKKQTRAKALKTQENNLLKKLERIRKQQNSI